MTDDTRARQEGGRQADGPVTVERLHAARRDEALASLARAFWPDPVFGFFSRGPIHEHRNLPVVFSGLFDDARRHGEVWMARVGERCIGTASWLPPGALPRGTRRDSAIYARLALPLVTGRNRRRAVELLTEVDRRHPHEPHWYLVLLGVDPAWQRRGIGGRLLEPVLGRCDAEGLGAYLETQKPENVAFYHRFGFEVRDEIVIPGSPRVWLLWRASRG